ncbi:MAG: 50S ribosomal protein L18 [candidate division FCPU426 bacterium]
MFKKLNRKESRTRRHVRLRKKLQGTPERPRLSVYRSLKHFHVQLVDDIAGVTLVGVSTLDKDVAGKAKNMSSQMGAKLIGELIAKKAQEKNISSVVFDRGGIQYHGAIKALAESARGAGLKF